MDFTDVDEVLRTSNELLQKDETRLKAIEALSSLKSSDLPLFKVNDSILDPVFRTSLEFVRSFESGISADEIANQLKETISSLKCVNSCLDYVLKNCSGTDVREVLAIPEHIPEILLIAFEHCRQSRDFYPSDVLPFIQDPLNEFFQTTRDILIIFGNMVDKNAIRFDDDEVRILVRLTKKFVNLHSVLAELDYKSLGIAWKSYARLCKSHHSVLKNNGIDISDAIHQLSTHALLSINKALKNKDTVKTVTRELQIGTFCLKVLRQQCELFSGFLGKDFSSLVRLMSTILTLGKRDEEFPEDKAAREKFEAEFPSFVLLMIQELIQDADFAEFIISGSETNTALLICIVLVKLPLQEQEIRSNWMKNHEKNLFRVFLDEIDLCDLLNEGKPFLKSVQFDGKPVSIVMTYEYILCRTQAFVAGMNESEFYIVERSLFRSVLSSKNGFWSRQLSVDVLCFMSRYGQAELCARHMSIFCEIYHSKLKNKERNFFVESLLSRLLKLLTKDDLNALKISYPPKDYLHLWAVIGIEIDFRTFMFENIDELTAKLKLCNDNEILGRTWQQLSENNFVAVNEEWCRNFLEVLFLKTKNNLSEISEVIRSSASESFLLLFAAHLLFTLEPINVIDLALMILQNSVVSDPIVQLRAFVLVSQLIKKGVLKTRGIENEGLRRKVEHFMDNDDNFTSWTKDNFQNNFCPNKKRKLQDEDEPLCNVLKILETSYEQSKKELEKEDKFMNEEKATALRKVISTLKDLMDNLNKI